MKALRLKTACVRVAILWLLFAPGGCALVVRGRHQDVSFHTEPESATISVESHRGVATCVTPCQLRLERQRSALRVHIEKEGHRDVWADLDPHALDTPVTAALQNLDELLVVPALLDLRTDAFWDYPDEVRITLRPLNAINGAAVVEKRWSQEPPSDLPIQ